MVKRKIGSRFVPHSLSDEQKETRIHAAQDFIGTCDEDSTFLETFVTGDESVCYLYAPESERQTMKRCAQVPPPPAQKKRIRPQKSRIKVLLIDFFNSKGMINQELVPQGQTVNAEFNETVLKRLLLCIRRVPPHIYKSEK